jgi:hypothetical protein
VTARAQRDAVAFRARGIEAALRDRTA